MHEDLVSAVYKPLYTVCEHSLTLHAVGACCWVKGQSAVRTLKLAYILTVYFGEAISGTDLGLVSGSAEQMFYLFMLWTCSTKPSYVESIFDYCYAPNIYTVYASCMKDTYIFLCKSILN